jgi:hypothetical protein
LTRLPDGKSPVRIRKGSIRLKVRRHFDKKA